MVVGTEAYDIGYLQKLKQHLLQEYDFFLE